MPHGPEMTRPLGTIEQNIYEHLTGKIDSFIKVTEGHTVKIWTFLLPGIRSVEGRILQAYKDAGWKYVYISGDNLILSSDPNHQDLRVKPANRSWWHTVRHFVGLDQ